MMSDSFKTLPLSEVLEKIVGGGTPSKAVKRYYEGQIPWVTVKDLSDIYIDDTVDHITEEAIKNSSSNYIEEGQVIIATRMALGKAFINKKGVAINQDFKALYSKKFIDNHYLLYSLLQKEKKIKAMGSGTTVKGIRLDNLKSLPIGIPPLKEQQKIAAILSSVDEAIEKTEQIIEQTETVKKGLMQQLLTKGIGHKHFKKTAIGEVPKEWEIVKLSSLFTIKHGYAFESNYYSDRGDYILLTPGNFSANGGLKLKGEKEKFYLGEIPKEYLLEENDLLIVLTDLTKECKILGSPAFVDSNNRYLHNQRLGKIKILDEEKVTLNYLYYIFNSSRYRDHLKSTATGTTVKHTSPSKIYELEVPLPSISEQNRIVKLLELKDEKIQSELKRNNVLKLLKQGLMQQLLTGKVRVPINEDEEVPS